MTYDVVFFTGTNGNFSGQNTNGLPLTGLLSIKTLGAHKCAHELRLAGFRVLVVSNLPYLTIDEIKRVLSLSVGSNTLFIGFSNTFLESGKMYPIRTDRFKFQLILPHGEQAQAEMVDHLRTINPKCKIVVGGTRTFFNISNPYIDYAVMGFADISVVNLARHLKYGDPLLKAKRNLNRIIVIDDPVAEGFDFVNSTMVWTEDDIVLHGETLPLEISRGCIFNCSFCSYRLRGKKNLDYVKDLDILKRELIYNYERYGVTTYRLLDDTYNDNRDKIDMILDLTKSLPFKLEMWAYIRLDLLSKHPETIAKLIDTGVVSMFFGIETLHKPSGRIIGKGYDPEAQIQTIRDMKHQWGKHINLHGSFIVGLPNESKEQVRHTMQRLLDDEIPLDIWHFHPLRIAKNEFEQWQSAFGLDLSKYGYQEIPWQTDDDMIEVVNWQNPHMTFLEAKEISDRYAAKYGAKIRSSHAPWRAPPRAISDTNLRFDYLDLYKSTLFDHLEKNLVTQPSGIKPHACAAL